MENSRYFAKISDLDSFIDPQKYVTAKIDSCEIFKIAKSPKFILAKINSY